MVFPFLAIAHFDMFDVRFSVPLIKSHDIKSTDFARPRFPIPIIKLIPLWIICLLPTNPEHVERLPVNVFVRYVASVNVKYFLVDVSNAVLVPIFIVFDAAAIVLPKLFDTHDVAFDESNMKLVPVDESNRKFVPS